MVGAVRFELTTSCTRNKRASHATLRPEPNRGEKMRNVAHDCNGFLRFVGGSSKGPMRREQHETGSGGFVAHIGPAAFGWVRGRGDNPKWAHGRANEADGSTLQGADGTRRRPSHRYGGQ